MSNPAGSSAPSLAARLAFHVRARRRALGLTQEQLAERSAVGARTVQDVEAGKQNATLSMLEHLARGLAADPLDLLAPAPAPKPRATGRPRGPRL